MSLYKFKNPIFCKDFGPAKPLKNQDNSMHRELEECAKEINDFSYQDPCPGIYNILNFSSFHIQDDPQPGSGIPTNMHYGELEGIGDSASISVDAQEFIPYGDQHAGGLDVNGFLGSDILSGGDTFLEGVRQEGKYIFQGAGDFIPYAPQDVTEVNNYLSDQDFNGVDSAEEMWRLPADFSSTTFDRSSLRIRYTRQYLLNCQWSSQSTVFPDCLLKYVSTNEFPLKRDEPKTQSGCRNIDHLLFYAELSHGAYRRKLLQKTWPHLTDPQAPYGEGT